MAFSKKTRKRRIERKKRRYTKTTRKMKGGIFFNDSKWQSIENIYYTDRIPRYLPNLPKGHESFEVLKRIIEKHGINSHCEKKDRFWETSLFPDKLKREKLYHIPGYRITKMSLGDRGEIVHSNKNYDGNFFTGTVVHKFKLFSKLVKTGQTCSDDLSGPYDEYPIFELNQRRFYSGDGIKAENYMSGDYNMDLVWCKAEFPPHQGWTCSSTAIEEVVDIVEDCRFHQRFKTNSLNVSKGDLPGGKVPVPYESNKITYYLNREAQFEVNCIRYAPGYINIEVVDLTTE
jgi:hypothetical protein